MEEGLNDYRCECGKLLFKGSLEKCRIEIKCRRCGEIRVIDFSNGLLITKNIKQDLNKKIINKKY